MEASVNPSLSQEESQPVPAAQEKIRRCTDCPARMSSISNDPHLRCVKCRDIDCNFELRCVICTQWSDDRMKLYLSHQRSLKRKRESKRRSRDRATDFSTLCTVGDSEYAESGVDESGSEGVRPSNSEIAEIVDGKLHNLANAWELRFKSLRTDLSKGIKEDFEKISSFLVRY